MKMKILSAFLCATMMAISLGGCVKKEIPDGDLISSQPSSQEQAESSAASEPQAAPLVNPFTGIAVDKAILNRPLAVMVNNVEQSLPQRGIADADIIYELPVEGAITRLMAVFADYKNMPDIGSIRSARHDYVELMTPFNPIYLHFGGSESGKAAIKENKIDDVDGLKLAGSAFYQDKSRLPKYSSEHTWFSKLDCLEKGIEKNEINKTLQEPLKPIFKFAKTGEDVMAANGAAVATKSASIKQSGGCIATFDYNKSTGLYEKGQYGAPHIDTNKNKACAVKNVLIMYTDVGLLPNGKNKEVNLSKGSGYYISNGKRVEVTFSKPTVKDNLKVMDSAGAELALNAGQTWICIVPDTYVTNAVFL